MLLWPCFLSFLLNGSLVFNKNMIPCFRCEILCGSNEFVGYLFEVLCIMCVKSLSAVSRNNILSIEF